MPNTAPKVKFDEDAWNALVVNVIDTIAVPITEGIAAACNLADETTTELSEDTGKNGYEAGTQGDKQLTKHDYRATVITATNQAMRRNAEHNTLINNLHAGDQT